MLNTLQDRVALVVLASGTSSRMGSCKFLLPSKHHSSLLEAILSQAQKTIINSFNIVTSAINSSYVYQKTKNVIHKNFKIIINPHPERERMYSLQCALQQLKNYDYCFIQNADNPFFEAQLINEMFASRNDADFICPVFNNKGGHPILINKKLINALLKAPYDSRLDFELKKFTTKRIDTKSENVLINIDTQEDYHNYLNTKE
ncbi:MAG: NTP transferase domain-containing protein [Bacteroidia bacterium]|nr:NTP transferase domain-containing protein [Bacteroidia bacterium]